MLRLFVGLLLGSGLWAQSYSAHGDERLAALIAQAIENSPGLRESLARQRAAAQRAPQLRGMPDPVLAVTQYARSPETRVGPQTTVLSISQRVPWRGKLRNRGGVAEKEADALVYDLRTREAELVLAVKSAYYELAYVDAARRIVEQELGLLEHFETLARARYSQGLGNQQGPVKLQAEITRVRNRIEELRRRRVEAETALHALAAGPSRDTIATVELGEPTASTPPLEVLLAQAREQRPELRAQLLRIEREQQRIHAARRETRPDFTLGAAFVNVNGRQDPAGRLNPPPDDGKNVYSVTAGVNLPIFRRKYRAAVYEASENFQAEREAYRDAVLRIEADVRSTAFRIETLGNQLNLFRNALGPQAQQALDSAEAAYSTGEMSVLELLDSQRTLLEVKLGRLRIEADLFQAAAWLERAVGGQVEVVDKGTEVRP